MNRFPRAAPSADIPRETTDTSVQAVFQSIRCRHCNEVIPIDLDPQDFEDDHGQRLAAISRTVACPNCQMIHTRYFSWEQEFGDTWIDPEAQHWHAEVIRTDAIEPEGKRNIGTEESWIELSWNLEHRHAWLKLIVANFDHPLPMWEYRVEIPEMPYEEGVDVIRHLTQLSNVLYSLYAASVDAVDLVPQMADALFDFRHFLERLEE